MIYAETVLPVTYPFDVFCIVDKCNLRHAKRNVKREKAGRSTSTYAERMDEWKRLADVKLSNGKQTSERSFNWKGMVCAKTSNSAGRIT